MSISVSSFRIEAYTKDRTVWMDYFEPVDYFGYINGVAFHEKFGTYAIVRELCSQRLCLLQFPNKEFLADMKADKNFEVVMIFGEEPTNKEAE